MSKLYLAGPMTNIPQFNFPLFHRAAAYLRGQGYDIVSPAEMDSPAVQAAAMASPDGKLDASHKIAGETWGQILAKDVLLVADEIDGIVFLPGWDKSRGANLEATVGLLVNTREFTFYRFDPETGTVFETPKFMILDALHRAMGERL